MGKGSVGSSCRRCRRDNPNTWRCRAALWRFWSLPADLGGFQIPCSRQHRERNIQGCESTRVLDARGSAESGIDPTILLRLLPQREALRWNLKPILSDGVLEPTGKEMDETPRPGRRPLRGSGCVFL